MTEYNEALIIGTKMKKVIDSSNLNQKDVVERYCCLGNRRLNELLTKDNAFSLAGMEMGLQSRFERKFGFFRIQADPIIEKEVW